MTRLLLISLIMLMAACSPGAKEPAQTTTVVISGPDTEVPKKTIGVQRFEVVPESVKSGEAVTVNIELAAGAPSRTVAIDWHGPDGWVIAHDLVETGQTRITAKAPLDDLDRPGRYRAVLRSGFTELAEDSVVVTE